MLVRAALVLAVTGLLAGCGGSSENDPNPQTFNVFIGPEGPYEGTLGAGGSIVENATGLHVGDREAQNPMGPVRGFLSFRIDGIPANANVTFAQLRLDMTNVTGNPIPILGRVVVDHMAWGPQFPPAAAWSGNQFQLLGNVGTLVEDVSLGTKTASVTFAVQNDRTAARVRTQLRLRWDSLDNNNDGNDTYVRFVDAEQGGGPGSVPILHVRYDVP
jgi:hypothetical protein